MKSLSVFGLTIKIVRKELNNNTYGEYDRKDKTITIDKTLKGDILNETILHEMFHAVADRISLVQAIPDELEEIINDTYAKSVVENFDIKPKKK